MENGIVVVKMAEMAVVENSKLLKTTLGSCVGVVLHDTQKGISGLAHIMLPAPLGRDTVVGKYAQTAIPALLSRILKRGSSKRHLRAYLVGGANMFKSSSDKKIATVGEKNIESCRQILEELEISIVYEDTGGEAGRTLVFDNQTGEIQVKRLGGILWPGGEA